MPKDEAHQTIRLFHQREDAPPSPCGFLRHEEDGEVYGFHLVRVRSRVVRRRDSPHGLSADTHHHAVYHLVLVTGGKGTFVHKGKPVQCECGDLLYISPHEDHHISPYASPQIQFIAMTFFLRSDAGRNYTRSLPHYLHRLTGLELAPAQSQPIALPAHIFNRTRDQLEHLLDLLLHPQAEQVGFQVSHLLLGFLGGIAAALASSPKTDPLSSPDPRLERVREHIEFNAAAKLRIPQLATLAGMSAGHLQRCFKQAYGCTPIAYQQQLRIERAKRMLRDTDWAIAAIAERIGYPNVYYFSTVFKQVTDVPPARFRRSTRA